MSSIFDGLASWLTRSIASGGPEVVRSVDDEVHDWHSNASHSRSQIVINQPALSVTSRECLVQEYVDQLIPVSTETTSVRRFDNTSTCVRRRILKSNTVC